MGLPTLKPHPLTYTHRNTHKDTYTCFGNIQNKEMEESKKEAEETRGYSQTLFSIISVEVTQAIEMSYHQQICISQKTLE